MNVYKNPGNVILRSEATVDSESKESILYGKEHRIPLLQSE